MPCPWAVEIAGICLDETGRWIRPMFATQAYFEGDDLQDELEAAVELAARIIRVYLRGLKERTADDHRLLQWVMSLNP